MDLEQRLKGLNTTADRGFGGKIAEGLRSMTGHIPGVGALGGAVGVLGTVMTAAAAAALAFFAVITKGLKEFAEAEKSTISLNSALASTGQYTEGASQKIQDLSKEYQRFTGVSDETWQQAAAVLLQFGIQVNDLPRYFPVIEALAGRMGGSVPAAAEAFAKAINGNFRPLQQLGIYIKDANTEQERFEALSKAAASGAGVLRAQNEGLAGSWEQLSTAIGDAWEALGGVANAAGVPQFFQTLAETIRDLTGLFEKVATPVKAFFDILPAGNESLKKLHEEQNKAGQSTERTAQRTEELKLKMEEGATATDTMGAAAGNLVPPLTQAATAATTLTEKISAIDKAGAFLREAKFGALDEQGKFEAMNARLARLRASIDDVFQGVGQIPPAADASAERIYLLAQSLGEIPREQVGKLVLDFAQWEGEIGKVTAARQKEILALREKERALIAEAAAEGTSTERKKAIGEEIKKIEKEIAKLLETQGKAPGANEKGLEKWLIDTATAAGVSQEALGKMLGALQVLYSAQANAPSRPGVNPAAPYGGNPINYVPGPNNGNTGPIYVAPAGPGLGHGGDPFWLGFQERGGTPSTGSSGYGGGTPQSGSSGWGGQQNAVQQGAQSVQVGMSEMANVTAEGFKELASSVQAMHRSVAREIARANTDIKALQRMV